MVDPLLDGQQSLDNDDEEFLLDPEFDADYEAEQAHNNYEEEL
jgi:hypothetical protein